MNKRNPSGLVGYKNPGRREMRDKLRAMAAPPVAKNCPDLFAEDKEFMRLFRESKRIEGIRGQRAKFNRLKTALRARGTQLLNEAAKAEESTNAA